MIICIGMTNLKSTVYNKVVGVNTYVIVINYVCMYLDYPNSSDQNSQKKVQGKLMQKFLKAT